MSKSMRRNSDLYERMCRGDMDAWADPGAILEMMVRPGDEDLSKAAIATISLKISSGMSLSSIAAENLSMVIRHSWDRTPDFMRYWLILPCAKENIKITRNVAMFCLNFLGHVYSRGGDPLFIETRREKMIAGEIESFSRVGSMHNQASLHGSTMDDAHPLLALRRWCIRPSWDIVSYIGTLLWDDLGVKRVYIGSDHLSLFEYVCSRFNDPDYLIEGSVKIRVNGNIRGGAPEKGNRGRRR